MSQTVVLVTGAAGFLGGHVARHCLKLGFGVVGVDDLSGGFLENVPDGAKFVQGDLTDPALVMRLFAEHRFQHVYHLAAYAAEGRSHFVRRHNYHTNLIASVNLLNECLRHRIQTLVFASSIAVYGAAAGRFTEETPSHPEDPYAISKHAFELELETARRMFGLRSVILRPHNVYGEGQNLADPHRNVVGIFMRQCLRGEPLTIYGDGQQTRAFTHVDDVAPWMARCVEISGSWNRTINIGSDESCTLNELARKVSNAMNVPVRTVHLPERMEVRHAVADHTLFRGVFGPSATTPLDDGIRRMAEWARTREGKWPLLPIPPAEIPGEDR